FHAAICVLSVMNFFVRYSVNLKQINRIAGGGIYGTGDEIMTLESFNDYMSSLSIFSSIVYNQL
ncbi:unnamed protein product, partial [Rotaria sordida]